MLACGRSMDAPAIHNGDDTMLNFQPVTMERKAELDPILQALPDMGCEYSLVNMILWGGACAAVEDGVIYVFTRYAGAGGYFLPAGGDLKTAVKRLAQDARARGVAFSMFGVTDRSRAILETEFPGTFSFYEVRSGFDYCYDIRRLAELKGKKLQAKRNHIHRFEDACPDWHILPLNPDTLPRARQMADHWYAEHERLHADGEYRAEQRAIGMAFDRFAELGLEGLMIESGGRIVAITMGSRIRTDVFDVNFEKAVTDVQGAYAMINRTFARYLSEKYPELNYLNREDDMGIPGLRKSKLSYYPDLLLRKWVVISTPEAVLR